MTPTKTRPPKAEIAAPVQGMATVTDVVQAPTPTILLDVIEGPARRAASCLLAPKAGDRVWFVRQGDACFVTAVLECAAEGPTCLDLPGDVTVRAAGTLGLAGRSVCVDAEQSVRVETAEVDVRAKRAHAVVGELAVFARTMVSQIASSTWLGTRLEQVVDHFVSHARSSSRTVDGVDQLHAGTLDHRADGSATLAADHTFLQGRTIVKADGGQIHIG